MTTHKPTPVLIIGAGPTGLVLALWLTRLNIPVRIIDKAENSGETSRALAVHARSLEFYQQLGIAEDLISQGIKVKTLLFRKNGESIATIKVGDFGIGLSPYPFILSLPQDDHEKILISYLKKEGVEVEWETELVSFKEKNNIILAEVMKHDKKEMIKANYLCGCDGAHSIVRQTLNLSFEGGTYEQTFFVADAHAPEQRLDDIELAVTRDEFCLVFPVRSSGTIRLIGIVPKECQNKEIVFSDVKGTILKNTGLNINKSNWFSTYHVHHRVVPNFRVGRVFLAGDAAHVHSPVGGQGMNTGIGDAVNLSWKLAEVLKGNCNEKILDTYQMERIPFAKHLVSTTDKLFQIVTSTSWLGSMWRNFFFPHVLPFILNMPSLSHYLFKFVSQIQIKYRKSPLSISSTEKKLKAGDRLPWIDDEAKDNFSSLQNISWQVHIYGIATSLFREKLEVMNLPLFEFNWGKLAHEAGLVEHAGYLIRPDGYISVIDLNQTGDDIIKLLVELKKP